MFGSFRYFLLKSGRGGAQVARKKLCTQRMAAAFSDACLAFALHPVACGHLRRVWLGLAFVEASVQRRHWRIHITASSASRGQHRFSEHIWSSGVPAGYSGQLASVQEQHVRGHPFRDFIARILEPHNPRAACRPAWQSLTVDIHSCCRLPVPGI